jgi:hypothetical protein
MQIIYDFGISLAEYNRRSVENVFPVIERCPCCGYPGRLNRHGFYWRNAVFFLHQFRIPILRLKCSSCDKTVSILPDFLLPYFQYTLRFILKHLRDFFFKGERSIYYQLLQFYRRRFSRNLNRIVAYFRDKDYRGVVPGDPKEKAIKLLDMICAFPKAETFAKRFQDHFQSSFMAN